MPDPVQILATAGALIAVNKPAGLLVIPGRTDESAEQPGGLSLRERLEQQLKKPVWVVHRIDRDTSGVVLFALDAKVHRDVSMAWERGEVKKRYVALVQGRVTGPLDIDLPLIQARKRKMRVAHEGEGGKESRTLVRPRQLFAKATLVECEPLTGRQHQIRVHLRAKGHPLLVDHQYGRREPLTAKDLGGAGDEVILARTPLHAESLALAAFGFRAEAPLPPDIVAALAVLSRPA
jgi:tRNA pseudouridine32 synthase/23S rRNA pseudouridine746 synthase/23S rRNA pseudouridine955/2504/2580 synthase